MDVIALIIGVIYLGLASWHDFRTREVPDTISYGFLSVALAYGVAKALIVYSWTPLFDMLAGFFFMFLIGLLLFFTGQWGGADTKILMGLGALLGLWLNNFNTLIFLIVMLFSGAAYGMIYTLLLAIKFRGKFFSSAKRLIRRPVVHRVRILVILLTAILLFGGLLSKTNKVLLITGAIITYSFFYLWVLVKTVEESVLLKTLTVDNLREGDWIKSDLWVKRREKESLEHYLMTEEKRIVKEMLREDVRLMILRELNFRPFSSLIQRRRRAIKVFASKLTEKRKENIKKEIGLSPKQMKKLLFAKSTATLTRISKSAPKLLRKYRFSPEQEYLCGPKDLGISNEQIERVKSSAVKSVEVKEGIPFVPNFLISYLLFWFFRESLIHLLHF